MPRLLLATRNPGKLREYRALLAGDPQELVSLDELGIDLDVDESGSTFAENARLKARAACRAAGLPALADDSGLEIRGLDTGPGVHSTRFAGPNSSPEERLRAIIELVRPLPAAERAARYFCALAVVLPAGELYEYEGSCQGVMVLEPRGQHGFGYDSIFFLPEHGRTMAELEPRVKNRISHRARAVKGLHWSGALERLV